MSTSATSLLRSGQPNQRYVDSGTADFKVNIPPVNHGSGGMVQIDANTLATLLAQVKSQSESGPRTIALPSGDKYLGEMQNGVPHGRGLMTFSAKKKNLLSYEGEFENGKMHGPAVVKFASGHVYEGRFENDHPTKGKLTCPDQFSYSEGEFWGDILGNQEQPGIPDGIHLYNGTYWYQTNSGGWGKQVYANGKRDYCFCTIL